MLLAHLTLPLSALALVPPAGESAGQAAVALPLPSAGAESAPALPEPARAAEPPVATTVSANDPALAEIRIPGEADPLAPINRVSYAITQPIDRFILRPAAVVYKTVVPHPLRDGARNAIRNLNDPVIVLNDLLQLHPGRAIKSTVRFILNSTVGLGGLFDVARRKPFHIPHHANGFGDTLGFYGVPPLLYLYLPVLGPATLRDLAGEYVDDLAHPRLLYKITHPDSDKPIWKARTNLGKIGTAIRIVDGLDQRAEADDDLARIRADSVDPYARLRADFLQDRAGEIAALKAKDGAPPQNPSLEDPLTDPAAGK
jgi:phospholipid-binding lipoprotein MlaA